MQDKIPPMMSDPRVGDRIRTVPAATYGAIGVEGFVVARTVTIHVGPPPCPYETVMYVVALEITGGGTQAYDAFVRHYKAWELEVIERAHYAPNGVAMMPVSRKRINALSSARWALSSRAHAETLPNKKAELEEAGEEMRLMVNAAMGR